MVIPQPEPPLIPSVHARATTAMQDVVEVGPFFTFELDEPLRELLGQMAARKRGPSDSALKIACVARFAGSPPDLKAEPSLVTQLADMRVELRVRLTYELRLDHPTYGARARESAASDAPPRMRAMLRVSGHFDPDDLTGLVGLQPTRSLRTGKPIGNGTRLADHDSWTLASPAEGALSSQLDELFAAMTPRASAFRRAIRHFDATAQLEVDWRYTATPSEVAFTPEHFAFAAELGLGLWIDPVVG